MPTIDPVAATYRPNDGCGEARYADLPVATDGALMVLDIAGRADIDPSAATGTVVDARLAGSLWRVGMESCVNNWRFDQDGDARGVRVGAFDMAGNFSGWSSEVLIDAPEAPTDDDESGGCVLAAGGRSGAGAWLFLAALFGCLAFRHKGASQFADRA